MIVYAIKSLKKCGKRRKFWLLAFPAYPTMFSSLFFSHDSNNQGFCRLEQVFQPYLPLCPTTDHVQHLYKLSGSKVKQFLS